MTPDDRLYRAIDGHVPDRVPVVPKIWVDLAARLTGTDLPEVIADPFTALRVIGQAGRMCRADAVRSSTFPVDAFSKATDEYGRWTATGTRSGRSTCRGGWPHGSPIPSTFRSGTPRSQRTTTSEAAMPRS